MTHPNESLSPLNGDAGVAQVGELLPCPFCGSDGDLRDYGAGLYRVECKSPRCPAFPTTLKGSRSTVFSAWNRRAANTTGTVKGKRHYGIDEGGLYYTTDRARRDGMDCNWPDCGCCHDAKCSDAPASSVEGEEPVALTEKLVAWAMLDAWNDICSDTGCHPLDIEQVGRKRLEFHPDHWVRFTFDRLISALKRPSPAVSTEVTEQLRSAFRNADDSDWKHLFAVLPDTGRGRFWKAVMTEARAALLAFRKEGE